MSRLPHVLIPFTLPALLLFTSCASLRLAGNGEPLHDTAQRNACWQRLQDRYPGECRLVQRIALHAMGKQYDMIGYLVLQPNGDFRAVAMGEMGGRIFDLAFEHGEPKINKKPEKMPPRPLLDGVIGDLRHLFTTPRSSEGTLYTAPRDGGVKLSVMETNGKIFEAVFSGATPEIKRTLERGKWRVEREAEFSDTKILKGFNRPIPTRIKLVNHRWHYAMEVQTLEIHPGSGAVARPAKELANQ